MTSFRGKNKGKQPACDLSNSRYLSQKSGLGYWAEARQSATFSRKETHEVSRYRGHLPLLSVSYDYPTPSHFTLDYSLNDLLQREVPSSVRTHAELRHGLVLSILVSRATLESSAIIKLLTQRTLHLRSHHPVPPVYRHGTQSVCF